jgi:hypothetical protein
VDEPNPYEAPRAESLHPEGPLSPIGRRRRYLNVGGFWGCMIGGVIGVLIGPPHHAGSVASLGLLAGALVGYLLAVRADRRGTPSPTSEGPAP